MARKPRLAVAGLPHFVVQRGGGQPVFRDDTDRMLCVAALQEAARSGEVAVHAYCLLDDGLWLLASPRDAADLGRFMQRVSRRYVPAFHLRHGGGGALWAGRFQAAALDPQSHVLPCLLMIEQAPVKAGLVVDSTAWAWSSAGHHTGRAALPWITEHAAWWRTGNTPFEREARHEIELQRLLREDQVAELLGAAQRGWALGSPVFLTAIERVTGRTVRARPRGRPRLGNPPNQ